MIRPRTALLATVAAAALLAGCGGGEATQGKVRDKVEEVLLAGGFPSEGENPVELNATEAAAAASCVAQTMFESTETFSPDDRNDIAGSSDNEPPSEELVDKLVDLVERCVDEATTGEG